MSVYLGMTGSFFIEQAEKFLFPSDIIAGLIKGMTFGIIIVLVGCYRGLSVSESAGAEGVGRATASSAVISFILIIVADFLLNYGIYTIFGG